MLERRGKGLSQETIPPTPPLPTGRQALVKSVRLEDEGREGCEAKSRFLPTLKNKGIAYED
jgi:hypothetical protein